MMIYAVQTVVGKKPASREAILTMFNQREITMAGIAMVRERYSDRSGVVSFHGRDKPEISFTLTARDGKVVVTGAYHEYALEHINGSQDLHAKLEEGELVNA